MKSIWHGYLVLDPQLGLACLPYRASSFSSRANSERKCRGRELARVAHELTLNENVEAETAVGEDGDLHKASTDILPQRRQLWPSGGEKSNSDVKEKKTTGLTPEPEINQAYCCQEKGDLSNEETLKR